MSERLKHTIDFSELYMKRKERLTDYKEGKLGEKTKAWLGFPSKIYQNWQAHWTLDDEHLGVI